jgi:hypothetical protein
MQRHSINKLNGEINMPAPQIYLADDGSVQEVLDSKTLTVEELDERIANAQDHVSTLQSLRDRVVELTTGDAPVVPPAVPGTVELTVTPGTPPADVPVDPAAPATAGLPAPANSDAGQAPVDTTQVPQADAGAFNNGQVDPAAASNPTAPVADVPATPAAPVAAEPSVPQPVISA